MPRHSPSSFRFRPQCMEKATMTYFDYQWRPRCERRVRSSRVYSASVVEIYLCEVLLTYILFRVVETLAPTLQATLPMQPYWSQHQQLRTALVPYTFFNLHPFLPTPGQTFTVSEMGRKLLVAERSRLRPLELSSEPIKGRHHLQVRRTRMR